MEEVNEAWEKMLQKGTSYRFVIDVANSFKKY
jgi:D-arabinose 1-dehydrogenase-like Zn-dependent alcohol dehydrogenase